MALRVIAIIGFSILSGILYRCGGSAHYNTKFRDMGCPLVALVALWSLQGVNASYLWAYVLAYGLMFGSLTTYWDFLFHDVDNFYMHGLVIGLTMYPLAWCGITWYSILLRSIALSLLMGVWSNLLESDIGEEFGRGFFIIATLPLMFF